MPSGIRPDNPFATRHTRPGALPFLTDSAGPPLNAPELAQRAAARRRTAIAGPHGTGKTTLLAHLRPHLEQETCNRCGWVTLRGGERPHALWSALSAVPTAGMLVVDGYEQLGTVARLRLITTARFDQIRLLVTAHRPPWAFEVLTRTGTSRETARLLAAGLLEAFPAHREPMLRAFDERWEEAGGNVRQLWATLYEQFEHRLSSHDP